MKHNARSVYIIAILGLLLATTLFCGCTSSENSSAPAKTTLAPTTTPVKTVVTTAVPTSEQSQKAPVAQVTAKIVGNESNTTAKETNVTAAHNTSTQNSTAPSATTTPGNMTAQKSVKNETSKESVPDNSSSAATVEVKQTGSKQTTKSVEATIETSPMSKASAANKTATV